jgi:hypothetical protein
MTFLVRQNEFLVRQKDRAKTYYHVNDVCGIVTTSLYYYFNFKLWLFAYRRHCVCVYFLHFSYQLFDIFDQFHVFCQLWGRQCVHCFFSAYAELYNVMM